MSRRAVCIHGHFYQPPRENPWLEVIEGQESAAPYHDWNERITAECYAPNAAARILNQDGTIRCILNNYSRMSFNIGPTLLSWMQLQAPEVYAAILDAENQSRTRFSGHSSAIAQAYAHGILPLSNARDKRTQVLWGIEDFKHRFGHDPEGFWLPETAVDVATLEVLAQLGIRFTVLAPHQIGRVRKIGEQSWLDVGGGRVNPRMPYRIQLPSGNTIAIFAYDGPIAHEVSFGTLLENGERFKKRLLGAFNLADPQPQLVHLATDGEAYGHHRKFGDMALAYVLNQLDDDPNIDLTNYGEWLDNYPPSHEAEIIEVTSWSCVHGIERWRSDCGCNSGGRPDWNQSWRAPLRAALDALRDDVGARFEGRGRDLFRDPWKARDAYISVMLDRSNDRIFDFFEAHAREPLSDEQQVEAFQWMELQRHAVLMYASCGWFFDDISGIEATQVLRYAGRVTDLASQLFQAKVDEPFLKLLEKGKSNVSSAGDGRTIYEASVRSAKVRLAGVAAHHVLTAPYSGSTDDGLFAAYQTDMTESDEARSGDVFLRVGHAEVMSSITTERDTFTYAALHSEGTDHIVGVRKTGAEEGEHAVSADLLSAFDRETPADVRARIVASFGEGVYSLRDLFREEQLRLLDAVMQHMLGEIETAYRKDYERAEPLLKLLAELGIPLPRALKTLATFMLNLGLEETVAELPFDASAVDALFRQAQAWGIELDRASLASYWTRGLEGGLQALASTPEDLRALDGLRSAVASARTHEVPIDLWKEQNAYYQLASTQMEQARGRAELNDVEAIAWLAAFDLLGKELRVDASIRAN